MSFDVSCLLGGVQGDNCATIIVKDQGSSQDTDNMDWRGIPVRSEFESATQGAAFVQAQKLVNTARQALYAAIATV